MADLHEIVSFADDYLNMGEMEDYGPQGLQVEGASEVTKIVTGVSACMELFEEAKERGAQAVMVHHGMFWNNEPRVVKASLKDRLKFLLVNDISLIGYHLVLDRSEKIGNNIKIVEALGLTDPVGFGKYGGKTIGYMAKTGAPLLINNFIETVRQEINPDARHYSFGPESVEKIAIVSGGAPQLVREAVTQGADLYLTGEETEWIYHFVKEEKIHYVAAGHHATERFGIKALGEKVGEAFGITVDFVDIENPI